MWALDGQVPPDNAIRLQDALASLPLCELFSINQVDLEKSIEEDAALPAAAGPSNSLPLQSSTDIELAMKRLCEGLISYTPTTGDDLWALAADKGIPLAVARKSAWAAARQFLFSRKRKRDGELAAYGGSEAKMGYMGFIFFS